MDQRPHGDRFTISVVAPLYNEENNLEPFLKRLERVFERIGCEWEVVFAMDPSPDRTEEVVKDFIRKGYPIRLIKFSRRIGKPLSVMAGLNESRGDATVVIDVDLQDPPELISDMVRKWVEGYKVVLAQRISRRGENICYLAAARCFYWLASKFSEYPIHKDTGDFRLLDSRVVNELKKFNERHAFLRGLTAAVGFETAVIPFSRDERYSGRTNISVSSAFNIALDGLIPFSRAPVRIIFFVGGVLFLIGVICAASWAVSSFFYGMSIHWPLILLICLQLIVGGIAVAGLGVLGEYVVRVYEEVRRRPLYVVEDVIESEVLIERRKQAST